MKKILFPTDFSAAAENAFAYALAFAEHIGGQIITLHAYELPRLHARHLPRTLAQIYEQIKLEEFENYHDHITPLTEFATERGQEHLLAYHMLEEGPPVPTVLRVARREQAELIIQGTKGSTGLKTTVFGTVAGEVLENAPCPVLAIPERATFDGRIDRLAVATTFLEEEKAALNKALEFAALFDAEVHCVNVNLTQDEEVSRRMESWQQACADNPKVFFHLLDGSDLKEALSRFLTDLNIDILTMLTHRRKFFEELLSYSITKHLSYHLDTPILAVQSPEDRHG